MDQRTIHPDTLEKIRSDVTWIRARPNPTVFVVEADTEMERVLWNLAAGEPEHEQIRLARELGIPVLDGGDVIRDLPGHMALEAEEILREEILCIQAAREDKVALLGGPGPESYRLVPVEDLTAKDVDAQVLDILDDLTGDQPVPFTIPPSQEVLAYLAEQGERDEDHGHRACG